MFGIRCSYSRYVNNTSADREKETSREGEKSSTRQHSTYESKLQEYCISDWPFAIQTREEKEIDVNW